MKNFIQIACLLGLILGSCKLSDKNADGQISTDVIKNPESNNVKQEDMPVVEFKHQKIDFGVLVQGERFDTTIYFTNVGKTPMLIQSVQGSCGCTVAKNWPKTPIAPGEQASFSVTFDSEGKQGQQHKSITILANTYPSTNMVVLHGKVLTPNN